MVNFKPGKEIEKDVFRFFTSVGQRKKNKTDAFHMNFAIDLAHRKVSVAQC